MPGYITAIVLVSVVVLGVALSGCTKNSGEENNSISVREALEEVLRSAPPGHRGGFVIFGGERDLDYVQYALDPNGLLLNWPTVQEGGADRLPLFTAYLKAKGYSKVTPKQGNVGLPEQIMSMPKGQYIILDDGLYCQAGRDVEELRTMTLDLMKAVFGVAAEREFKITLDLDG